jgi:hypothetical protein
MSDLDSAKCQCVFSFDDVWKNGSAHEKRWFKVWFEKLVCG